MRFISSPDAATGSAALAARLGDELGRNRKVLWLVCGGSNIDAEVKIMQQLSAAATRNLTVMLTDERYGPPGHADSNWQQLSAAGFDPKQANCLPLLRDHQSFEQAIADYLKLANQAFADQDLVIALFGIGGDGHIAGILPDSPAATETPALAAGYDSSPYQRLTLTFPALRKVDVAFAFSFGDSKHEALQRLQNEQLSLTEQPSQILKVLPEAFLYSDQITVRENARTERSQS